MKDRYITITGFKHYYGLRPFAIGNLVCCIKEPGNPFDSEAIKAVMPLVGKVGHVANSPSTLAGGTMSAGRIYDLVKKRFYVRVMFTTCTKVICKIEFGDPEEYKRELKGQMEDLKDDFDEDDDWETCDEDEISF
ncbi:hypothetical protein SDC9_191263 [bioreactor metagenome]|uniref:HIRAN domain-containing protein n=1 Tax=bioreactor metagenome TaxID=1076179 RepID=A0A645I8G0_9ZZZZ